MGTGHQYRSRAGNLCLSNPAPQTPAASTAAEPAPRLGYSRVQLLHRRPALHPYALRPRFAPPWASSWAPPRARWAAASWRGRGRRAQTSRASGRHRQLVNRPRKLYCTFYHRFGACRSAEKCQFLHNPSRIRLCRFALAPGGCKRADCLLNHKSTPCNTPHCIFFERGHCKGVADKSCLYIHVKHSLDAPECLAFSKEGYCKDGLQCSKRHVFQCEAQRAGNSCNDPKCRFSHSAGKEPPLSVTDGATAPPASYNFMIPSGVVNADAAAASSEAYSDSSGDSDGESFISS